MLILAPYQQQFCHLLKECHQTLSKVHLNQQLNVKIPSKSNRQKPCINVSLFRKMVFQLIFVKMVWNILFKENHGLKFIRVQIAPSGIGQMQETGLLLKLKCTEFRLLREMPKTNHILFFIISILWLALIKMPTCQNIIH